MATPTNDSYNVPSGGVLGAGRGSALPAWMTAPVGQWGQISGTEAPGELKDFCGLALREEGSIVELISAANGGHGGNLTSNRVMGLRLELDTPVWATRRAADDSTGWDTTGVTSPYFPGGKPAPRHTYQDIWFEPLSSRVVVGGNFWGSSAATYSVIDGFRVADNDWDAAGTFPNHSGFAFDALDPATGVRYSTTGFKYVPSATPGSTLWSAFTLSGAATTGNQGNAFDTTRGNVFHLSFGNGTSNVASPAALNACQINISTGAKTAISFNASSAYTLFLSERDVIFTHALVYDEDGDCFYLYCGQNGGPSPDARRIYKITPNGTTTWDISVIPGTGGVTPGYSLNGTDRGGVNNKFRYHSYWNACTLVVPTESVYYLRVR